MEGGGEGRFMQQSPIPIHKNRQNTNSPKYKDAKTKVRGGSKIKMENTIFQIPSSSSAEYGPFHCHSFIG
jgi:hypothetical protein